MPSRESLLFASFAVTAVLLFLVLSFVMCLDTTYPLDLRPVSFIFLIAAVCAAFETLKLC